MAEPLTASVQYGDLKGTVAFDGHDGPPLRELAQHSEMPGGYIPVALQMWHLLPDSEGMIRFRIMAVDASQAGKTIDEISQFAKSNPELPVYPFDGKIPAAVFAALFKRFNLVAVHRSVAEFNVVAYSKP